MSTECVPLRALKGATPQPDKADTSSTVPGFAFRIPWLSRRRLQLLLVLAGTVIFTSSIRGAPPPGNIAPAILSFEAVNEFGNYWDFRGEIDDELPGGCVINFGGLLDGHSVDVDIDGTFSYVLELDEDDEGLVTAQAVDSEGLESEIAEDLVVQ